jgi:hypothetical protein
MKHKIPDWSKHELQIYILLLAANADKDEASEEIDLIRSKTDPDTFLKVYKEFRDDKKKRRLKKIQYSVENHEYSHMELAQLRKEVYEVFFVDNKLKRIEQNLDRILDNILY